MPATTDDMLSPQTARPASRPAPANKRHHPLATVRHARDHYGIRSVICAVSGGKDSVASLDLCVKHFDRVEAFFMYVVEGLSFQERYLTYLEKRFGVRIWRIPHWSNADLLRIGHFRHRTVRSASVPALRLGDVDAYARKHFGIEYVATGIKYCDSIERQAQIVTHSDIGVSVGRKLIWPLAYWTPTMVWSHLAAERIMLPPDYRLSGFDLSSKSRNVTGLMDMQTLVAIKAEYPEDYAKIEKMFPMCGVLVQRYQQLKRKGKI